MVGGWWRLAVGGWWRLAVGGWWRLAVGGWWRLAVGGWWRLAVGGWWRVAVGGPWVLHRCTFHAPCIPHTPPHTFRCLEGQRIALKRWLVGCKPHRPPPPSVCDANVAC